MSNEIEWMSVPEVAERLGVPITRVREMLREQRLPAQRRGENAALAIPSLALAEQEDGWAPVPTIHGTLTLLADLGFSEEDRVAWLLEERQELGMSPLRALAEGRRAPVRRLAQASG